VTGIAGNFCVLFTANDAYMRDYDLIIPSDCTVSNTSAENRQALTLMRKFLKADTRPSARLRFVRAKNHRGHVFHRRRSLNENRRSRPGRT